MAFENQLFDSATTYGADYFGVADLTPARETIFEQGGTEVAEYPRSISIGIALFHPIVNQLLRRPDRNVAVSYRSHCYDIINARLDEIISRIASVLQREGHKAYPVPASKRLGWIGKNCLLITPDMGPRVRWATVLTDAPLSTTDRPMNERCENCGECVDICPVRAFTGQPFRAGEPRAARFDAGKCDRYFSKMKEKDAETALCGLCLYTCPYGRKI